MTTKLWRLWLVLGPMIALLGGCATLPIEQTYREQAGENIPLAAVQLNPAKYVGTTVIWGGKIIANEHTENGSDLLILQMPLNSFEKPKNLYASEGRFIAKTSEFLDPEIYKVGTRITIAGQVSGQEARMVGKANYQYPTVDLKQIVVWKANRPIYYWGEPPYYYYYYWPYPYYYSDWDFHGPGSIAIRHFGRGRLFEKHEHFHRGMQEHHERRR
jgi:outer membrane lipoprotein